MRRYITSLPQAWLQYAAIDRRICRAQPLSNCNTKYLNNKGLCHQGQIADKEYKMYCLGYEHAMTGEPTPREFAMPDAVVAYVAAFKEEIDKKAIKKEQVSVLRHVAL